MAVNLDTIEKMPLLQKALIVVGVILLIYVISYFMVIQGKQSTIKQKEEKLSDLQYQVSQGKAVLAKIEEYEQKQKELEKELKEAERRLPREPKIPELLEKLSDLVRGNELAFSKFHPGKESKGCGGICREIELDVNLVGDYHSMARFFDQVSKLERIVNVRKLEFEPAKGKTDKGKKLKAKVTMITYKFAGGK